MWTKLLDIETHYILHIEYVCENVWKATNTQKSIPVARATALNLTVNTSAVQPSL